MNRQTLSDPSITLRPPEPGDAERLFPLIYRTRVTDTLVWDGPASLPDYEEALSQRRRGTLEGKDHYFVIVEMSTGAPMGTASLRPYPDGHRGDIGLWIGEPFHGKGYGTRVIGLLIGYGFGVLNLRKIEGTVFVGNRASRRIFEKNGFRLEGTIRMAVVKRGVGVDEWLFGILREEFPTAPATGTDPPAGPADHTGPPSPEPV
jgi:RimJ/RimL family protein N-acetyltransferase